MTIVKDHISAGGEGLPSRLNKSAYKAIVKVIKQKKESKANKGMSKEDDVAKQGN